MEEKDYYNVPIYIEKLIKKMKKAKENLNEYSLQVKDYMEMHGIPSDTPLDLLKYFPPEEIPENQMKMEFL